MQEALWAVIFLLLLTGCSKPEDIVLKVGRKEIGREEFKGIYKEYKEQFGRTPVSAANLVSHLIEQEVLTGEASKMGVAVSPAELESFMKENNIDERRKKTAEIFLLRKKLSEKLAEETTVSREQIDAAKKDLTDVEPERLFFYQILVNNQETAYKALDEIKKGGDFETAARQYSISPEGKRGGIVDYLNAEEIPVEITRVLKTLKPGEISRIIQSPYGYHILRLKELVKSRKITEEEKEERARAAAKKEAAGNMYADWYAKKKKEYKVNVRWEELEKIN